MDTITRNPMEDPLIADWFKMDIDGVDAACSLIPPWAKICAFLEIENVMGVLWRWWMARSHVSFVL